MNYLCLIYYDEQRVDAMTDEQWHALVARCLSCAEELRASGHMLASEPLQSVRIREARLPYHVPERDELPERLDSVLRVIYLVFSEGYCATSGDALTRADLCVEAIRLGRLLLELLPDPEVAGLLALMLLHAARADFCRQLGRLDEARDAYRAALALAQLEPERRFLQRRLDELG